jgi:L-alanine-DL-glutamate epimerase-like enolase superfamily enzyme
MDRIARVEAIPVSYPEPNDFDALRHLCLAKITTADGVVGWGESITQFPEASFATRSIIEGMAERVVGRDPLENVAIWYALRDQKWWYGYNGGIASYAVAAIDMALWDIKGKLLGTSVLNLLGGPVHERLPVVASCHAHYADIGRRVEGRRSGWPRGSTGSRSASASAATPASATSTRGMSSTCVACARAWARIG